jgi:NAD(P)-dependent dehydrogenase (short-subunit alcohol dehydrogenase family)
MSGMPHPLFDLANQVAVVTGAGAGIGRNIALKLASFGARVVAADLNLKSAEETAALIREAKGEAVALEADVASEASVVALFAAVQEKCGGADILVNNAGIFPKSPFLTTGAEKIEKMLAVNLSGTFLCMREAVRQMQEKGKGSIINISSVAALKTVIFDNYDYGASKAGVNNLTVSAALEFGPKGIRINAIMPGGVMTENAGKIIDQMPKGPIMNPERTPLGRIGVPDDIANAVLFFASPAASYITGQVIAVDGGFSIS